MVVDGGGDEDDDAFENEEQFWEALDSISQAPYQTHEHIDDALRSYLALAKLYKQTYLQSEADLARCCYNLLHSRLFRENQTYVRRQILYCLLEDDDADVQHVTAALLLFDGRADEAAFDMLQGEGLFPRLIALIPDAREDATDPRRLLLELLFEMSRVQRLNRADLITVDDNFVLYLLQVIEDYSDDADDPYHYPIIRVLLVLNEQYMCFASASPSLGQGPSMTNRILKLLASHGDSFRTFGENIILLLNRESTLSAQLLILKLLYLLFTTPSTYEYFYTNDLHVLVDVIIRNLLDLDPGMTGDVPSRSDGDSSDGQTVLRHTYLRVLCPLLKNTQLAREENHYKREEVRKLLHLLANRSSAHFAPVDETVLRLVIRCKQIPWLREEDDEQDQKIERTLAAVPKTSDPAAQLLGMSLQEAGVSSLSVFDVSAKVAKEKPAVPAPRRLRKKKPAAPAIDVPANGPQQLVIPTIEVPNREGGRSPFSDENCEVD